MKSVRKLAVLFLAFCIGTAGAGCSREETEEKTEYSLYYLSLAESSLETEGYEPTERTTEAMVEEVCRLTQEEERLNGEIRRAQGMLANEKFVSRAPEAKVQEERDKLEKYTQMLAQVKERMAGLRK